MATKENTEFTETTDMGGFDWDDNAGSSDISFFGEEVESKTAAATVVEAATKEEEGVEKTPEQIVAEKEAADKAKQQEIEDNTFFEDEPEGGTDILEEEEGEEGERSEETDDQPAPASIATLNFLKEKGMATFELEEGAELTETKASELLEDSYDASVEARVEELFKDLPDAVKDLNKYALGGGNVGVFLKQLTVNSDSPLSLDLDVTTEENQILIMKSTLTEEGYDKDYIEAQIGFLKDSGNLEKTSKTKYDKWSTSRKEADTALITRQTAEIKQEKANQRETKNNLSTFLGTTEEVNGVALSKEERKTLPDYMTNKNVKLENGSTITTMQKDLYAALKDRDKAIIIGKFLQSNFDLTSIKNTATSKVVEGIRDDVRQNGKTNTPVRSTRRSSQNKSLADFM